MLAAATGEHSVLVEVIIHLRGHQTRQRIAEQRRKLEYAQTQPIQQIIHRKRRDRREQVFENDRVNADGVAHGVEMAAGIIVDINRFNRHFDRAEHQSVRVLAHGLDDAQDIAEGMLTVRVRRHHAG